MRLRQVISLTCLAAVILFGGYLMLPQSAQYIVTPAVAAAAGGVALWRASRRNDETAAWWLMGIGLLQATCGEALWGLYDSVWNIDPFPSMADVFYLAYYPLVALALERLLRHRTGRDSGAVLDATVAALGIGVLLWQFVVAPQLSQTSMGSLEIVISVAYPAADILLLGLVLRLAFARHAMGWTGVLLASGIAMMFLADVTWMLLELTGSYAVGNVIDLAYLASYAMLGAAAAMNPSHAESGASKEVLPTGRLVLLVTTSLSAPAVLIWQGATSADIDTLWVGVVSGVLFVLVLLRMHGLVRRVEKQAWQLEQPSLTDALTALPNRRSWDLVTPRTFAGRRSGADVGEPPVCAETAVGRGRLVEQVAGRLPASQRRGEQPSGVRVAAGECHQGTVHTAGGSERVELVEQLAAEVAVVEGDRGVGELPDEDRPEVGAVGVPGAQVDNGGDVLCRRI